jgi:hypothetical protein
MGTTNLNIVEADSFLGPISANDISDHLGELSTGIVRYFRVVYDFATMGGFIGSHPLNVSIPEGGVPFLILFKKIADWTSGGAATVALSLTVDGALFPDIAITDGFWTAPFNGSIFFPAVRATAIREIQLDIGGADLTAGSFIFDIVYLII